MIKDWLQGKIKFFAEPPEGSGTRASASEFGHNKNWLERVRMTELQHDEDEKVFPLLNSDTLQTFTSYGDAPIFARGVDAKFLKYLEDGDLDEDEDTLDGMDEVEDEEEEDDESDDDHDEAKGKGKEKAARRSTKKRHSMDLNADFDFAEDFVATSDAALVGGMAGDDEDDDDDYAAEEDEGDDGIDDDLSELSLIHI